MSDAQEDSAEPALSNNAQPVLTSEPAPVTFEPRLEPRLVTEPKGSKAGTASAGAFASAKRVLSTRLSVMRQLYSSVTEWTTVSKLRSLRRQV